MVKGSEVRVDRDSTEKQKSNLRRNYSSSELTGSYKISNAYFTVGVDIINTTYRN